MLRTFLLAKIHQASVTHADPDYEGSFSIDSEILDATGIIENEQVHVYNITSGHRFITYAIRAPKGSRMMGANGACAHRVKIGDRVIICVYAKFEKAEWGVVQPTIVFCDSLNNYRFKEPSC